jgi:hypothetical protein
VRLRRENFGRGERNFNENASMSDFSSRTATAIAFSWFWTQTFCFGFADSILMMEFTKGQNHERSTLYHLSGGYFCFVENFEKFVNIEGIVFQDISVGEFDEREQLLTVTNQTV